MKRHWIAFTLVICITFGLPGEAFAIHGFDIGSGGQPTITGALNGSVTGSSDVMQNLVVTINFGEVSPANPNSVVKVTVPIAIRSDAPYQLTVSMTGANGAGAQAIQFSDIGFGVRNLRIMGSRSQTCTNSSHIFSTLFNNDPVTTAIINSNGRVAYQSTLNSISGSTLILSGPRLTEFNGTSRRNDDGWIFDAVLVITPQYFSAGTSSATLTFTISAGPNVPC
jgi:spore coat protein U-like protein